MIGMVTQYVNSEFELHQVRIVSFQIPGFLDQFTTNYLTTVWHVKTTLVIGVSLFKCFRMLYSVYVCGCLSTKSVL